MTMQQQELKKTGWGVFKKDLHEEMSFKMSIFISAGNKALNKKDKSLPLALQCDEGCNTFISKYYQDGTSIVTMEVYQAEEMR